MEGYTEPVEEGEGGVQGRGETTSSSLFFEPAPPLQPPSVSPVLSTISLSHVSSPPSLIDSPLCFPLDISSPLLCCRRGEVSTIHLSQVIQWQWGPQALYTLVVLLEEGEQLSPGDLGTGFI